MTAKVNHRVIALVMAVFASRAADVGRCLAAVRKGRPFQRGSASPRLTARGRSEPLTPWVKMPLPGGAETK